MAHWHTKGHFTATQMLKHCQFAECIVLRTIPVGWLAVGSVLQKVGLTWEEAEDSVSADRVYWRSHVVHASVWCGWINSKYLQLILHDCVLAPVLNLCWWRSVLAFEKGVSDSA